MARHASTILCTAVAALVALGLIMLASTSAWVKGVEAALSFPDPPGGDGGARFGRRDCHGRDGARRSFSASLAPWMYGGPACCSPCVSCPGIGVTIFGSSRWIQVPFIGQFQPSELAKIVVVLCLAAWFARWQTEVHTFWRGFVMPGMIAGVPGLLIAAETDIGTALSLSVAVGAHVVLHRHAPDLHHAHGARPCSAPRPGLSQRCRCAGLASRPGWIWKTRCTSSTKACSNGARCSHSATAGPGAWASAMATKIRHPHLRPHRFHLSGHRRGTRTARHPGVVLCYVLIAVAGCGIALQAKMFSTAASRSASPA
jgi:hypothetical protein